MPSRTPSLVLAACLAYTWTQPLHGEPPAKAPEADKTGRLDGLGDPLPEGALLRLGTVRFRHPRGIFGIALSPDGTTVATAGSESIRLWAATTGKSGPVFPYQAHNFSPAQSLLAFSTNGRNLFFPRIDGVAKQDLVTGQTQIVFAADQNTKIHALHPSPDDRLLAVGTNEGVRAVELASGRVVWSTQNGRSFLPPARDDRLFLFGPYSQGRFSPDGKVVAVNASDAPKTLRLLDARTGEERRRVDLGDRLVRLVFSPDGRQVAATERDNAVRVYETATGRRLHSWTVKLTNPYENYTSVLAFSPDGATLAAGATDHLVHLWDLRTGSEGSPLRGHTWYVSDLVFAADGRTLFSAGLDGCLHRWDTGTWQRKPSAGDPGTGMVAHSPIGRVLAWEGDGGVIHLTDTATGKKLRSLPGNPAGISHLTFAPDGSILAAGGSDLSVQLWEMGSGKLLRQWKWPKGKDPHASVEDIAFTPDGRMLATASFRSNEVLLWDVRTGVRLGRGPHEMAGGVIVTPDGRTLISAGWDRAVRWWNLPDLRPRVAVTLPEQIDVAGSLADARLHWIACSPDGRLLATANLDGVVSVWDALNRKLLHSFRATSLHSYVAFSPDGQWLATGGFDGGVALWEPGTGRPVLKLAGHPGRIQSVAFGPDGRTLLTGSDDNTGLLWDLRPKTEARDDGSVASLWDALAGADAAAAYRAVWLLADRPERSVPFLKGKLTPARPIDRERLRKLLDSLDSDSFAEREAAAKDLATWGEAIEPELQRELSRTSSAEKRRRLRTLLDGVAASASPEDVRRGRAVVVLEWAKTPEARHLLEALAKGAPEAQLTREAKMAQERLARQPPGKP
jgi:WD40 repeat protein